jgi:Domain of unknown function (DUF4396)
MVITSQSWASLKQVSIHKLGASDSNSRYKFDPQAMLLRPGPLGSYSRLLSIGDRRLLNCRQSPIPRFVPLALLRRTYLRQHIATQRYHSNYSRPVTSPTSATTSWLKVQFWASKPQWNRAVVNTFRCLIGCTLGDFSALWILQSHFSHLGVTAMMGISSK